MITILIKEIQSNKLYQLPNIFCRFQTIRTVCGLVIALLVAVSGSVFQ